MAWPMLPGETETQLSLALFLVLSPVEAQLTNLIMSALSGKKTTSHSFILGAS